ncbi:hypothetical protein BFP72_12180 [Reichenbachiella sp. 5M10]|uniref:transglutaminase-like domain-containing protein n=1 Tax=Reichenbachiella sp. 5M10 TaxID=1889772 RepID=UPI000C15F2B9|nr:transglutaminase family protein [Reichenbachiella sp. 5M10]PIB36098.1 hypothetical protein BFP72_12180 [Reichenbachiella sp. 5M10]
MPTYQVSYQTQNSYEYPVNEALFALLVLPAADEYQSFVSFTVQNNIGEGHYLQPNLHGFDQLMIRASGEFTALSLQVDCQVEVAEINPYEQAEEPNVQENELLNSIGFKIDHHAFLAPTRTTSIIREQLPVLMHQASGQSCSDFLNQINRYIFENFSFYEGVNSLLSTPSSTLETRAGVCQDFAQLFIATCRANGIPARYVSGYLNQGEGHIGSAMMHAWVEALIPGVGWQGYDPTNNLLRDSHYIKVCHGVDYEDCSPIRGVLSTQGDNFTSYTVQVTQQQ